jgi:chromosome segregation ATPase
MMDERRKVEVLRTENNKLAFRLHALEQETARKRVQLRAERLATRTLREQLSHVEKELAEARGELELAHADLRRALLVRE